MTSWFGTCFAEQAMGKDATKKIDDSSSIRSGSSHNTKAPGSIHSKNDEKIDLINSKMGLDRNFTWFKVGQGLFTTRWIGISRTNVTILNKDKTEEIANYNRSYFTVVTSSTKRYY